MNSEGVLWRQTPLADHYTLLLPKDWLEETSEFGDGAISMGYQTARNSKSLSYLKDHVVASKLDLFLEDCSR
jgi:hypothetical protein